jgi:hypothetical protein
VYLECGKHGVVRLQFPVEIIVRVVRFPFPEPFVRGYVQFALNDYYEEKLETGVPSLSSRMDIFKKLVDRLGYGKVIWRFDPLILAKGLIVDDLLEKIYNIGVKFSGYTEKLVFSKSKNAAISDRIED